MHPILAEHPGWRELQDRRAAAERARRQALEAVGEWEARYHAAKAAHDEQIRRAAAGDGPPPPAFAFDEPKPDAGAILTRVNAEQATIRDAEREFLRRYGPELHGAMRDREAALLDEIRTAVEKLAKRHADTLDELNELTAAAAKLARANGTRGNLGERASTADVVGAVLDGHRLVAELPGVPASPPHDPQAAEAHRDQMAAARAGFAATRSPAAGALRGRR